MLYVDIIDRATPAIERMDNGAPQAIRPLNKARGERWQTGMQAATPLGRGRNPGKLIQKWELDPQADAFRLHNDTDYLRHVIQGRKAIVAKGKALHFRIDGKEIFARRVGPAKPNDFISRTLPKLATGDPADAAKMAAAVAAGMK